VKNGKHVASVGSHSFEFRRISEQILEINGKEVKVDFRQLHKGSFSLILGGISCVVEHSVFSKPAHGVQGETDGLQGKTVDVSIKGKTYTVVVDDNRSMLLKKFVTKAHIGSGEHVIKAPMPGLISRIEIQLGEEVSKGHGLLVLEAMKMENEIRANHAGRIKTIHVEKGKPVEKDQPLITIEEL
jgi:biotin carboxyl carrier protein